MFNIEGADGVIVLDAEEIRYDWFEVILDAVD